MMSDQSGGALAKPGDRTREILRAVGHELDIKKTFLASMLPREITPDRLRAFTLTAMQRTPRLQQCSVPSLLAAVYECARAGLAPDAIDACVVPYKGEAQFQLMFRGCMKLARRAGTVVQIWSDTVRENDVFEETRGMVQKLEHVITGESGRPYTEEERGGLIAAYACARFADGFVQTRVVYEDEIDRAKRASKTIDRPDSPWRLHEPAMWEKTAIKRLCKLLPMPDEAARAIQLDDLADAGISQNIADEWSAIPNDAGPSVTGILNPDDPRAGLDPNAP